MAGCLLRRAEAPRIEVRVRVGVLRRAEAPRFEVRVRVGVLLGFDPSSPHG